MRMIISNRCFDRSTLNKILNMTYRYRYFKLSRFKVFVLSSPLIDNIFTRNCNSPYSSCNLVITLCDHHAQFLIMKNQPNISENKKEDQLYREFQEIKKLYIISKQLENVDSGSELRLEHGNSKTI